jgi:endonuclease/exonuclease/phosphatase (EEP) superfamily protein YafD
MEPERLDRVLLVLVAPLALLALVRLAPLPDAFPLVAIEAELGWLLVPAWGVLLVAGGQRRVAPAALAALPCAVHAWLLAPLLVPHARAAPEAAPRVTLATANLLATRGDFSAIAAELGAIGADVLVVVELTPEGLEALDAAGALAPFAERVVLPRDDCFGIAVFSRHPIVRHEILAPSDEGEGVPMIRAELDIQGTPLELLAVHTMPPMAPALASLWRTQLDALVAHAGASERALVVAGDLNLTPFGRAYDRLRAVGLRGAHELAGRGLATTWPNDGRWIPPMRLDHVLVSPELAAISVREGVGEGSDHRPVIAELVVGGRPHDPVW